MKPKLLITLGCSWTEGIGCYNPPISYNTNKSLNYSEKNDIIEKFYNNNLNNFHQNGWPKRIGIKLGFDKVVNLGYGGASHSYSVKRLYEYLDEERVDRYEILIIWLMTEPVRFSFYINGRLRNFQLLPDIDNPMASAYLNEMESIELDPILEQKFYLKTLENLCELKNMDLITTSWNKSFLDLHGIYKSKSYLHKTPVILEPPFPVDNDGNLINYSFCSHPNENGYEWIANEMVKGIKENHSKWYSVNENPNISYSFKGKPKQHNLNLI